MLAIRSFHRFLGLSTLTLAVLALVCAGCGGGGGGGATNLVPPTVPSETTATIGTAGGEVEVPDGSLSGTKLMVPAGALTQDEVIRISKGSTVSTVAEHNASGPAVKIEPHGLTFAGAGATLRIPYDPSLLPPGTRAEDLVVLKKTLDGTIHRLEVVGMPAGGNFLEVKVTSLSSFQAVLTSVDASGQWVVGAIGEEFDPSQFDVGDFNLEDFDWSDFDPNEFDFSNFDFANFDLGGLDLGNLGDLGNLDLSQFDLGSLGGLDGLPVQMVEIVQNTAQGTFEILTGEMDVDGNEFKLSGTFSGPRYQASGIFKGEDGTETVEIEFEIYSESFGSGTSKTTIGSEVTNETLGLVRAESLLEEPTFGPGLSRITLNISDASDPSDATLSGTSLEEGSYSGTFVQLAADETTGLVIATYLLDSDTGNPFLGTVSGSEYLLFRMVELGDGETLIEILQLTRTSKSTFESGTLGQSGFAWFYSDGGSGLNFGTGSASLGI